MVQFNFSERTIKAKVVYYGPPQSGKTTNLEQIHRLTDPEGANRLISLNTAQDRTLFFDLLPFSLGRVSGYDFKIQLYTVPGQVQYNATRRVVLAGADAVVFVADSQQTMERENLTAFENMKVNLLANRLVPEKVPLVLQYNKRDLQALLSREELDRTLNPWNRKAFEAVAARGDGVLDTFVAVVQAMLATIAAKYNLKEKGLDPAAVPEIVAQAFESLLEELPPLEPEGSGPGAAQSPVRAEVPESSTVRVAPVASEEPAVVVTTPAISPARVVISQPPDAEPAYPGQAGSGASPVSEELLHRAIRSNVELAESLGTLVREVHLGLGTILSNADQLATGGSTGERAGVLIGGIRREATRLRQVMRDFGQAANRKAAPSRPAGPPAGVPASPGRAVPPSRPAPRPPAPAAAGTLPPRAPAAVPPAAPASQEPPTLDGLLAEVVGAVRQPLAARGLTVQSRIARGSAAPRCSPAGLRRALAALLQGLSVEVPSGSALVARAERKPVLLRGRDGRELRRDFLMLALTHGPGLGPEDQQHVLKGADTGRLGEAYRLVREMGGFLRFAPLPQGLLETRVFLPL